MPRSLSHYLVRPLLQWRAGLLDCLPPGLRNSLAPVVEPYVLELGDAQARLYRSHEGAERQLGILDAQEPRIDPGLASVLNGREAPLVLLLPPAWVLRRQITLPAAAQENLGQVIRFEMDRLTPFSADQVYYDCQVDQQSPADELIPVSVALVPRKKIESWLSLLDGANVRLDRISAAGLWPDANFLPPEARPAPDIKRALLKMLPAVVVAGLLLVAMAQPLWQKRSVAEAMQSRELPLKKQANEVISIREQLLAEQKRQQQLYAAWTRYPPALDVLKVITDLLPDDTSLQQMDIKGLQLVLRGNSSQASSLIKLLEESSGFSDVKFMSSVVQQRGKEQFHLSANIVVPFVRIVAEDIVEPDIEETESTLEAAPQESAEAVIDSAEADDAEAPAASSTTEDEEAVFEQEMPPMEESQQADEPASGTGPAAEASGRARVNREVRE